MALFKAFNGPAPTTVAQQSVTTGTAIKTLMQLSTPTTARIKIISWGISFDGSAAGTPIKCELIETDVAAVVSGYVAADIVKLDGGDPATLLTLGNSNSGYTSTSEGTIATTRQFDAELVAPTNQYIYQFPLGQEPIVAISKYLRIRVTAAVAVNAICWINWSE
jgi:hypothetical protein